MRFAFVPLCAALLLSACQTPGTTAPPGGVVTTPTDIVGQIANITQGACRFLPTASTIISILSLGDPSLATAAQVASAICAAQESFSQPRSSFYRLSSVQKRPTVGGVVIEGRRV